MNLPGYHTRLILSGFLLQPPATVEPGFLHLGDLVLLSLILKEKHRDQLTLTLTLTHSHIQLPSYNLQEYFKVTVTLIQLTLIKDKKTANLFANEKREKADQSRITLT